MQMPWVVQCLHVLWCRQANVCFRNCVLTSKEVFVLMIQGSVTTVLLLLEDFLGVLQEPVCSE